MSVSMRKRKKTFYVQMSSKKMKKIRRSTLWHKAKLTVTVKRETVRRLLFGEVYTDPTSFAALLSP